MSERDGERSRERSRERLREKDRDRDRYSDRYSDRYRERDRDRDRDRYRYRDREKDDTKSRHRTRSPEPPRKRHKYTDSDSAPLDDVLRDDVAAELDRKPKVDPVSKKFSDVAEGGGDVVDEEEMMRKMGIPVGFDTTKGRQVTDADVSGIRAVTKRQPRQYMNRRGGFNRPLPAETNR